MTLRRLLYRAAVLLFCLVGSAAHAVLFTGTVTGYARDPASHELFDPPMVATFSFCFDPTTSMSLLSSDGVSHASYSFMGGPSLLTVSFNGTHNAQGLFNQVDLFNDPTGQKIVFDSGTPLTGGLTLSLVGLPNAFFTNLDPTTLRPGPLFLGGSSANVSLVFANFEVLGPMVTFIDAAPEPDSIVFLGGGLLLCLGWRYLRTRRARQLPLPTEG